MCVFIVRLKQPGLFGGSIRHRPPDTSAAQPDARPSACRPDRGSVRLLPAP